MESFKMLTSSAYTKYSAKWRRLSHDEALDIMDAISKSSVITGYSYNEWTGRRDSVVMTDVQSGQIAAVGLVHHLMFGWSEIAVMYVDPNYRGQGLGEMLLRESMARIHSLGRRCIIMFCSEQMCTLIARSGFQIFNSESDLTESSLLVKSRYKLYTLEWLAVRYRRTEIKRKRRSGLTVDFNFSIGIEPRLKGAGS